MHFVLHLFQGGLQLLHLILQATEHIPQFRIIARTSRRRARAGRRVFAPYRGDKLIQIRRRAKPNSLWRNGLSITRPIPRIRA